MAGRCAGPEWREWRSGWWTAVATLVVAVIYLYGYDRGPVEAKQSFSMLPSTIGSWSAIERIGHQPPMRVMGADQELKRVYRNQAGRELLLYIAYLNAQAQGRELVNYLTAPLHGHVEPRALTVGQASLVANVGTWEEGRSRMPLLFWYQIGSRTYADRYEAKAATIAQAVSHQGSHGALVLLLGDTGDGNAATSREELGRFASELAPLLDSYMP
jgi:EpsI family protein